MLIGLNTRSKSEAHKPPCSPPPRTPTKSFEPTCKCYGKSKETGMELVAFFRLERWERRQASGRGEKSGSNSQIVWKFAFNVPTFAKTVSPKENRMRQASPCSSVCIIWTIVEGAGRISMLFALVIQRYQANALALACSGMALVKPHSRKLKIKGICLWQIGHLPPSQHRNMSPCRDEILKTNSLRTEVGDISHCKSCVCSWYLL